MTKEEFKTLIYESVALALDEKLKKYPMSKDLENKLIEKLGVYPTTEKLEKTLEEKLLNYPTKEDFEEKISEVKNSVLTTQDKVMKELGNIRTEQASFVAGQKRQDDQLDKHENRIGALELKTT